MTYKSFTKRHGTDCISVIEKLRKEFPGCKFAAGIYKDTRGIFCFSSDVKEYGEHFLLENGDTFWLPTQENLKLIKSNLSNFKTEWTDRVAVKLKCGVTLEIYPASAVPRLVMLSLRKKATKEITGDNPYSASNSYGRMAYEFYFKSQKNEEIRFDSEEFQNFIRQALTESYTLPIDVIDALQIISVGDFDHLFAAAMGYNYEMLLDELPKSNAASEQTTGANAV
jgi:hypothetical protein